MKICIKCNQEKSLTEFHTAKRNSDGLEGKCKSCKSQYRRSQYLKRRDEELAINRKWKSENKDRYDEICKEWYYRNKEYHNALTRKHYKENKSLYRAKDAKYRASKLKATPLWADLEQIKRIYVACAKVSERTGVEHHVDHIIPLQGENVCGLHVERNLAIIPAKMNLEKSNSFASWATK